MATRQSTQSWLLRDLPRLGALSGWALAAFLILAYGVTWPALPRMSVFSGLAGLGFRPAAATKPTADAGNAQGVYTGSILFVPPRGEICGQWAFDNRNGAMWDNGQVNCRPASAAKSDDGLAAARMIAIGRAFKND